MARFKKLPLAIIVLLSLGSAVILFFVLLLHGMPSLVLSETNGVGSGVAIFDRYDHLVCHLDGDENRMPVPLSKVAHNMQMAAIAAEDHRFFNHHGIDLFGAGRALVTDVHAGRAVEGASTITEQLVKNLYFKSEPRNLWQKARELVAAFVIEMRYSKAQILESYLNQIYLGSGAYGIERASQIYFAKEPSQLSLGESAFLAGIIRAPSELGSPEHRSEAMARQRDVLNQMVADDSVKQNQADAAANQLLRFRKGQASLNYPYYISYVMQLLKTKYKDKDLYNQGLRVYTNLDPVAEMAAKQALAREIKRAPAGINQSALVSISVADGAVIALVGGVGDYWNHQWNRATNPHTAGSAFKPFVYLAALNNNVLGPDSTIDDSPLTVNIEGGPSYSPKNFDGKFLGPLTVRKALALSRNVCAVRVAQAVGIASVIDTAHRAGISSKLDNNLSLALGSSAVSPLELAGAYSTLARDGVVIEPHVLRRIDNARGETLEAFPAQPINQFAGETVAELVDVMQDVVKHGTGKAAQLDRPVAGKTGTADQSKDVWFVGFTPDLVTAVWSGSDDNTPVSGNRATGGTVAARCWHDYMSAYYQSHAVPITAFTPPARPLAPESDFSAEPPDTFADNERLAGGHSQPGDSEHKPGLLHRIFHHMLNWF